MSNNKRIHELSAILDTLPEIAGQFDREQVLIKYEKNHLFSAGVAIKILSIFGGILASCFFIAFLFATGIYESETALIFWGAVMIILSVVLNRMLDNILLDTILISLFLIGNVMWTVGFNMHDEKADVSAIIFILIGVLTLFVNRSYMLSFLAVIFVTGSTMFLIFSHRVENLLHLYVIGIAFILFCWQIFESNLLVKFSAISRLFSPVRIALQTTLLVSLVFIKDVSTNRYNIDYPWILSIGILILIILLLYRVSFLFEKLSTQQQLLFFGSIALVLAPTLVAPSIIISCFLLLLTFYSGHVTGIVLSSISFVFFISRFYYDLSYSLLTKSIVLMVTGFGFGVLYFILSRNFDRDEQA